MEKSGLTVPRTFSKQSGNQINPKRKKGAESIVPLCGLLLLVGTKQSTGKITLDNVSFLLY